jgi:hypothetical protein
MRSVSCLETLISPPLGAAALVPKLSCDVENGTRCSHELSVKIVASSPFGLPNVGKGLSS